MKALSTVLVALLALADVITTGKVLKKLGVGREQNPLVRALYKAFGKFAPALHVAIYGAFIALPWWFPTAGHVVGNLLLSVLIGVAVKSNLENLNS